MMSRLPEPLPSRSTRAALRVVSITVLALMASFGCGSAQLKPSPDSGMDAPAGGAGGDLGTAGGGGQSGGGQGGGGQAGGSGTTGGGGAGTGGGGAGTGGGGAGTGGGGAGTGGGGAGMGGGAAGTGGPAVLTLAAATGASTDFGALAVAGMKDQIFIVSNQGQQPSSAFTITLSGADFTLLAPGVGDCVSGSTMLNGSGICSIRVRFMPSMNSKRTASLSVSAIVGGTPSLQLVGRVLTERTIPSFDFYSAIVSAPDGKLWIAGGTDTGVVIRLTTSSATDVFTVRAADPDFGPHLPFDLVVGSDNNLWFPLTNDDTGNIGRVNLGGVVQTTYSGGGQIEDISLGPDGLVWFVESSSNTIGKIAASGTVTNYPDPSPGTLGLGPDNAIWFAEAGASPTIRRMTAAGTVTNSYPVPQAPRGIIAGPDGNIWFLELTSNPAKIARMTPAGSVVEFPTPSRPFALAAGPDGNIWFTEAATGAIARITPAGVINEFPLPAPSSSPGPICVGPDGNIWFVETSAKKAGSITP